VAAVVADHPLAADAGAQVLRDGGNAIDAAITMAAVLAVVRPHMCGIGGDAFLLIRESASGTIHALNGSGRAGRSATPARLHALGFSSMPETGVHSVTVPGVVRAWSDALERFGTITLAAALAPAIGYAADGFTVSEKLSADLGWNHARLLADSALGGVFLHDGQVPAEGATLRQPDLAATLRLITRHGANGFYRGVIAEHIADFIALDRGLVEAADLAAHTSTWQAPIETTYEGLRVIAFPPNSQGVALLMQLNMAELFDLRGMGHNQALYIQTLVEIKRRVFTERDRYVTDPEFSHIPLERMVSKEYARELANGDPDGILAPRSPAGAGDTVFLGVVDKHGNAVALIQSIYDSFGSGRMVPGTGIVLHNRGALFSLDASSANVIAPGKRPYHTLAPSMVLKADALHMVIGTPGADGQTQTLLQVLNNIVIFGMTPQRAVEAPRWRSWQDGRLQIEEAVPPEALERLKQIGHDVRVETGLSAELGGAQVILIPDSGPMLVGADPRREAFGITV
jgi:gamma-glutamyltranspeptidase/glutathione hydrolase